jgi:pyridoxal phosphate enzyme (YggS family)
LSRADEIAAGLADVRARIAAAERAAGRPAGSVRLVAVSKKMTVDDVRAALAAGQLDLGESYGQELRDKRQALAEASPAPRWHFIGPLQANKVKYVAGHVALIHSIDSAELLDELERRGANQAVLVQVNVAGEAQKRGVAPDALPALLDRFATLTHVRCEGLMTVPPLADDPAEARPHFAALRNLCEREAARARPHVDLRELSMGMSHDLEVAVAEGATLVRVGTAIFGAR